MGVDPETSVVNVNSRMLWQTSILAATDYILPEWGQPPTLTSMAMALPPTDYINKEVSRQVE
jgi:hypothetical protein